MIRHKNKTAEKEQEKDLPSHHRPSSVCSRITSVIYKLVLARRDKITETSLKTMLLLFSIILPVFEVNFHKKLLLILNTTNHNKSNNNNNNEIALNMLNLSKYDII